MDKHLIHKALRSTDLLNKISTEDLATIAERFPYFTTAQLLLTKAYQQSEDYRFTDQLHQAAIYTPDRKILYDLVQKAKRDKAKEETPEDLAQATVAPPEAPLIASEQQNLQPLESSAEHPPIAITESQEKITEDDLIAEILAAKTTEPLVMVLHEEKEPVNVATKEETTAEEQQADTENLPTAQLEAADDEEPATTPQKIHARDLDPMQREILLEAISSSIELEVSEQPSEEKTIDTPPAPMSKDEQLMEVETNREPKTLAEYLALRAKQLHFGEQQETTAMPAETTGEKENTSTAEPAATPDEQSNALDLATLAGQKPQKLQSTNQREHQQSLIDKFIQSEPRITPGKAADYHLIPSAKESLEEDFEFVTETMARLYAQQGKTDKARKAFKKLMELYPEKSVYFAAQLKNLDRFKKP